MSTKFYGSTEAAKLAGLTLGSFRVYVSLKGVKGEKRGREVRYTATQIKQIMAGKRNANPVLNRAS